MDFKSFDMKKLRSHTNCVRYAPWFLLMIFALICYFSQKGKSVTADEFNHFPAGIYNISTQDWRMDRESPPLVKCFPAITSLITKPVTDAGLFKDEPNAWSFGYNFMFRNWEEYRKIFQFGRLRIDSRLGA